MNTCPVCYQPVEATRRENIASHWDSAHRDICPASRQPYYITIAGTREAAA